MEYRDKFDPRPFQSEVIEKVMDGFATDRHVTVALGTPGTGKTLTYQAVATHLFRENLIDCIAVFVPRVNLARDCETSWMARDRTTRELKGNFELFDGAMRFGKIRHTGAWKPLTDPSSNGVGFVSTYAALATDQEQVFLQWAEEHRGRFLLVADEAQFCGGDSNNGGDGGTQAGARIHDLDEYSAHTLLLTGTPYRADGKKLVLCTYSEPDEDGKQHLNKHVEATYADGIDEGYLRRFEMTLHQGTITENASDGSWTTEYEISSRDSNLQPVLRLPTTWEPIVDMTVRAVREKQRLNSRYRGLISCMEKRDVESVVAYLKRAHPHVRVLTAVSADGEAARTALEDFRTKDADLLVTVRMAFIGYDCKQITVIGVLTHYRDFGHLMQLIGRGLRVWDEIPYGQQSCRIITPDDLRMRGFLDFLREQQDEGVQRRELREREGGDAADREGAPVSYIAATRMTTARAVSNTTATDHEERMLIEVAKQQLGLVDDVTSLAGFLELFALRHSAPANETPDGAELSLPGGARPEVLTDSQHIDQLKSETAEIIRAHLKARGIEGGRSDYGKYAGKITSLVNARAGFDAGSIRTVEEAEHRRNVARQIASEA